MNRGSGAGSKNASNSSIVFQGGLNSGRLRSGFIGKPPGSGIYEESLIGGGPDGGGGGAVGMGNSPKVVEGFDHLKNRIETLEADLARRQESYIRRERAYKTRIEELEAQLEELKDNKTGWMTSDRSMQELKYMQRKILGNVEVVQERTAKILQEQERDLLRAFRARLFDLQTELEKEKSRKDDGAGAWIEKSRKLEGELDWTEEMADRLDRLNQSLSKENSRLRTQFKIQEEDRNYLIKQLVLVKKDNAKLRSEVASLHDQLRPSREEADRTQAEAAFVNTMKGMSLVNNVSGVRMDADHRYKELLKKMKRTLDLERRSLRSVRERLSEELQNRTELQTFLRQCIEDVRKQVSDAQGGRLSKTVTIDDFTPQDRERTLSLLLSQERVVTLLYAKTFPVVRATGGNSEALLGEGVDGGVMRPLSAPSLSGAPLGVRYSLNKPATASGGVLGSQTPAA